MQAKQSTGGGGGGGALLLAQPLSKNPTMQVLPSPEAAEVPRLQAGIGNFAGAIAASLAEAILNSGNYPFCWPIVEAVQRCLLREDLESLAEGTKRAIRAASLRLPVTSGY